jgi:hypothetical protein
MSLLTVFSVPGYKDLAGFELTLGNEGGVGELLFWQELGANKRVMR